MQLNSSCRIKNKVHIVDIIGQSPSIFLILDIRLAVLTPQQSLVPDVPSCYSRMGLQIEGTNVALVREGCYVLNELHQSLI